MPPQPPPETQEFNRDIQLLLKPNNPHARSLLAFIHRTIGQFGLRDYVTEIDVFVEAYLRGVRYTDKHRTQIRQPKAWMRSTAYNIIRECKRDRQQYSTAAFDELMEQGQLGGPHQPQAEPLESDMINRAIQHVVQAFESLDSEDQDLIHWKIVDGLTWNEIHQRLVAQGGDAASVTTLRKRGQRALEQLRRSYHSLDDADSVG